MTTATQPERITLKEAHWRALHHLNARPLPSDDEARFGVELEFHYHQAATGSDHGWDGLFELADRTLSRYQVSRCQLILDAVEELDPVEEGDRIRALLLKVKLFADLRGFDAAKALLLQAADDLPAVTDYFNSEIAAIELELAKLDRLRGNYEEARERYLRLERVALTVPDPMVVTHCNWQLSLVHGRIHDVSTAIDYAQMALEGFRVLVSRGLEKGEAEGRRVGVRKVFLKSAHVQRHMADLLRMAGRYAEAHRWLDASCAAYLEHGEQRSLAYANVLRSNILRLEGRYAEAIRIANAARNLCERGERLDERLHGHALRAEVLARVSNGERPHHYARALAGIDPDVYPAALTSGLLALAEMERRRGNRRRAAHAYADAIRQVDRSHRRGDLCSALIGQLECHRRWGDTAKLAPSPEELLDRLLAEPCVAEMPALGVRAQLQRAIWRLDERDEALRRAAELAGDESSGDAQLVARFLTRLTAGRQPPPMWLTPP